MVEPSARAVYAAADGQGYAPRGEPTTWRARSKPIVFTEYGFPTCDRSTNQPNVFFDAKSSESATPYWSVWRPLEGGGYAPKEDGVLAALALQAIYEYWVDDGNNELSESGVRMVETTLMSAWNWDARPFPVFPSRADIWGDAGNWRAGTWIDGKGPFVAPRQPDPPPEVPAPGVFPAINGRLWRTTYRPIFDSRICEHVSGRSARASMRAAPTWEIELSYDLLRSDDIAQDLERLIAFYGTSRGRDLPFLFDVPEALGLGPTALCRFADDQGDLEEFMARLWRAETITLRTVKSLGSTGRRNTCMRGS